MPICTKLRLFALVVTASVLTSLSSLPLLAGSNETIKKILDRGKIVVGVKADYKPWGLAVPLEERDSLFGRFMPGMTYWWHASGRLVELEKKWGIQPTQYAKDMHERFIPNRAHLK